VSEFTFLDRHNQQFLRQRGRFRLFAASDATIVLATRAGVFQVCQLGFSKDGSFRCAWPYLPIKQGIVAEVSFPATKGPMTFSLNERGKFTSQLVKFSHHRSGIAQFSLTGKVRNDVRRESFPLTGPIGRLFELHCFFPSAFKPLTRLKPNRLYLPFVGDLPTDSAFMIRGEWRRKGEGPVLGNGDVGPVSRFLHRRTGEEGTMINYGPPLDNPNKTHVVNVIGHSGSIPAGASEAGIVFLGGFDHHEVGPRDPIDGIIKGGLAAMYPAGGDADMRTRIGSIDVA
jgi:hypothetical protein